MRTPIVAALAALTLLAPLTAVSAQDRGEGRYRAAERQADRNYERARAQEGRGREAPSRSARPAPRRDYEPAPRAYAPPPRALGRGQTVPQPYRGAQIRDFDRYRLRPPPAGYDWVGVGPDIYLMQRSTGMVLEAIPGGY